MFSPTPTWLSEVDPELSQGKFFSLGTLNKKGGVLLSTMNPPPPPDPPLAKYKPHPFLEETLVGTSKVHTQVLRLLIPNLFSFKTVVLMGFGQNYALNTGGGKGGGGIGGEKDPPNLLIFLHTGCLVTQSKINCNFGNLWFV